MWTANEINEQIAVINGEQAPTIVIENATYLHSIYKRWMQGNIWIHNDRIVYVGSKLPAMTEGTDLIDAAGKKIVPGYIEPHVHPFQLYNPQTFADFASRRGTTTFISDNLIWLLSMKSELAFTMLDQLSELPFSYYWWARVDSQTVLQNEQELFHPEEVAKWLQRQDVIMTGELTGWPRLLNGDEQMMKSLLAAKKAGKNIEGHLPGASERTLAKMKLAGVDGDHEAMTVEDVEKRLLQGYAVTLRQSSIRPDLPDLLKGIVEKQLDVFDHLMMTTDGATPSFYKQGIMDQCIRIALDAGVKPIDAYQMASYNVAKYYNMTDVHSVIATGRYATLNFLEDERNPLPVDVLSKGKWLKRNGKETESFPAVDWDLLPAFELTYDLTEEDFKLSSPIGIEMVNDVITKPYRTEIELGTTAIHNSDECFLLLIDRNGTWRVNTFIKGFATDLQGFASSYSNTGDIILIGQDFEEINRAFRELKRIGGGMVIAEHEEIVAALPLDLIGGASSKPMEHVMEMEQAFKQTLAERGYQLGDAIYSLLFLQSTHLPYVRITPSGVINVMKNEVLIPLTER